MAKFMRRSVPKWMRRCVVAVAKLMRGCSYMTVRTFEPVVRQALVRQGIGTVDERTGSTREPVQSLSIVEVEGLGGAHAQGIGEHATAIGGLGHGQGVLV